MTEVFIVTGSRTPIGSFKKSLRSLTASQLGAIAIEETLKRVPCKEVVVDEVIMGQVCQSNCGQNPARQAAILANLPVTVPCTTINKVCSSGMKSIILGYWSIKCGANDIVIAGGQESMSNIPFYLLRKEPDFGGSALIDGILADGLLDCFSRLHMGTLVEQIAASMKISRQDQDSFAKLSYQRSLAATEARVFDREMVPVRIGTNKSGDSTGIVDHDEELDRVDFEKMDLLKPVFQPEGGTVTAANAGSLADGAACVLLASRAAVDRHGFTALAKVIGSAESAQDHSEFVIAPAAAIKKLLRQHSLEYGDIALWEINEPFAVAALANLQLLDSAVDMARVNVHGGAVSLGHPLGMSGARIVLHLALHLQPGQKGIAAICNGGGGASAILLEGC